jgi:hypothetical protein
MAFGIQIINTSNEIIVSEDFSNFQLTQTGSVDGSGIIPTPTSGQLLFVRAATMGATLFPSTAIGGASIRSTSGNVEYALVQLNAPPLPTETHGLRVYRADGSIAYDSSQRAVSPVVVYRVDNPPTNVNSATTVSLPAVATGKTRYLNSSVLRRAGVSSPITVNQSLWRNAFVTWNSDTSLVIGSSFSYSNTAAPAQDGQSFQGTLIFSFADI